MYMYRLSSAADASKAAVDGDGNAPGVVYDNKDTYIYIDLSIYLSLSLYIYIYIFMYVYIIYIYIYVCIHIEHIL